MRVFFVIQCCCCFCTFSPQPYSSHNMIFLHMYSWNKCLRAYVVQHTIIIKLYFLYYWGEFVWVSRWWYEIVFTLWHSPTTTTNAECKLIRIRWRKEKECTKTSFFASFSFEDVLLIDFEGIENEISADKVDRNKSLLLESWMIVVALLKESESWL